MSVGSWDGRDFQDMVRDGGSENYGLTNQMCLCFVDLKSYNDAKGY